MYYSNYYHNHFLLAHGQEGESKCGYTADNNKLNFVKTYFKH